MEARSGVTTATETRAGNRTPRKGEFMRRVYALCRTVHIYLTMLVLVVLVFFSATGFMLVHEEWFGLNGEREPVRTQVELPRQLLSGGAAGGPNELGIVEYLRANVGATGAATCKVDRETVEVAFRGPGRSGDITISRADGKGEFKDDSGGPLARLAALHKGKNAGDGWRRVLDVAAVGMFVASVTGLVLLVSLPKRRKMGLVALGLGVLGPAAVYWWLVP